MQFRGSTSYSVPPEPLEFAPRRVALLVAIALACAVGGFFAGRALGGDDATPSVVGEPAGVRGEAISQRLTPVPAIPALNVPKPPPETETTSTTPTTPSSTSTPSPSPPSSSPAPSAPAPQPAPQPSAPSGGGGGSFDDSG